LEFLRSRVRKCWDFVRTFGIFWNYVHKFLIPFPYFSHLRALKDQGYQSDSTLVFKKRNDVEQLSPVETKHAYKSFQDGGEVPLHGFRKHAPEKPKGMSSVYYFLHSQKT